MGTVNTYQNLSSTVDGVRTNVREYTDEPWEIPATLEGKFAFPEELSVFQVAVLDEIAASDNIDAELVTLRNNWGLSSLNANDVISAAIARRDQHVRATDGKVYRLQAILSALDASSVNPRFYNKFFDALDSESKVEVNQAINKAQVLIRQQQRMGVVINFDLDASPTSETDVPTTGPAANTDPDTDIEKKAEVDFDQE